MNHKSMGIGSILSVILAPFARRFIAGTTLADALDAVARLKSQGFSTTVDHLGENVTTKDEAKFATEQCILILKALKERSLDRNLSVKLSQIGLLIDKELCAQNLNRIIALANEINGFVRVDMEGSDVTQATLDTVEQSKRMRITPVGVALQAMLLRTPEDAIKLIEHNTSIRLCKGAYKEPSAIAIRNMDEIRRQFLVIAKRLITSGVYHGIATHDPVLINEIAAFARSQNISSDKFEFQMLLGIRQKLAKKMVADGWRVRIYVPFGRAWVPYTLRRLRERKENVWFIVKHLFVQ